MNDVTASVKDFILTNFLVGEDPDNLLDSTPLITSGLLDSLQRLDLVYFLEEKYDITFKAHEVEPSRMDTLAGIAELVETKQSIKRSR